MTMPGKVKRSKHLNTELYTKCVRKPTTTSNTRLKEVAHGLMFTRKNVRCVAPYIALDTVFVLMKSF